MNPLFGAIITAQYYSLIFYNVLLFVVVFVCLNLVSSRIPVYSNLKNKKPSSIILLTTLLVFIGLRPLSWHFGDMGVYSNAFESYQNGALLQINKDIYWELFVKFCSNIISVEIFFLLCATLYILPLYLACNKWFKTSMFLPFLMLVASFSFWSYGTNGIRNGIATSLLILGLSYPKKAKVKKYILFALAIMTHLSAIVPLMGYALAIFYKKPKSYLYGWLLAIPLSLILGSFWENLFASLGFQDERISYLTEGNINNDNFAYVGFRWDFVLYSASAICAGYYFIIKEKFNDKAYIQLFNIYVTANALWILVIRANFSNRFAYLSWFMMAIIIFYPFFKQRFFKNQNRKLAFIIFLYFSFTYFMTL